MSLMRPTAISLFTGAGGLDVGLERAGWDVITATDFDADSLRTLRASQAAGVAVAGQTGRTHLEGTNLVEADVRDLTARDLVPIDAPTNWRPDLLAGGPPCQPWSSAGLQRGLHDPRGQLIVEMLRLVQDLRPRFVLMENVRGLVTAKGITGTPGEVLLQLQRELQDLGYASRVATLNAADYGVPQRRVRLFLIATEAHALPAFPASTHSKDGGYLLLPWQTLGEVLETLPRPDEADVVRPSGKRADELRSLAPGTGLRTGGRIMANRPGGQWGYRQDSFVASLDLPARTVRAASTPDWLRLPGEPDLRRLTWRECAALQGFPQGWEFVGGKTSLFRQIGNAAPAQLAQVVSEPLLGALQAGECEVKPTTPPWPPSLMKRVRYTEAEHRVNGHLRARSA